MSSILDFLNSFTIEYLKSDGQREGNMKFLAVIYFAGFNVQLSSCCNHGKNNEITYVIRGEKAVIYVSNP